MRDTLEPLARETGTVVEVGSFGRKAIVRGDRDELVQVLQNLVQNALKYGVKGGRVRIEAKQLPQGRQAGRYAISVIDSGPGIAPQHLPRLTERFYRVDVASSREKGGTGLGLGNRQAHPQPPPGRARHRLHPGTGLHLHRAARSRARHRPRAHRRRIERGPGRSPFPQALTTALSHRRLESVTGTVIELSHK